MSDAIPPAATTASASRATFGFILVTVVFDTLAYGVMAPVLPKLLVTLQGGDTASAATILGLFGTMWAFMLFIMSPVLGALSDRFGRRPVILLAQLGLGADYVLMALAPDVSWLFVGRLIAGVMGASFGTANAYIADVTPPDQRAKRFGMIGAAWGFGFVVGPAVGGFLAGFDLRMPFWVSAGLCMANAAYGFFILPESLPKERRSPFHWTSANLLGSIKLLQATPIFMGLAGAVFFHRLGHDVNPAIAVIYAQYRFDWNEQSVGFMLGGVGVSAMIVQALLVGPAVKKLGERGALTVGLSCGALALTIHGLAPVGWMYLLGIPFGALYGLSGPAMQGMITRHAGASDQGKVQGAFSSVAAIATMIAPILFTQTFALGISVTDWPYAAGLPYIIAAVAILVALALALRGTRTEKAAT